MFWPRHEELRIKNLFFLCTNHHFIRSKFLVSIARMIKLNNSNKHFMPAAYQNIPCNTYASGCVHLEKKVHGENTPSQPPFFVLNSDLLCTAERNQRYGNNNLTMRKIKALCSWSYLGCFKPLIDYWDYWALWTQLTCQKSGNCH